MRFPRLILKTLVVVIGGDGDVMYGEVSGQFCGVGSLLPS